MRLRLAGFAMLAVLLACSGNPPPIDPDMAARLLCMASCKNGTCVKVGAEWRCETSPPSAQCPASCPHGTACTDPAKGCVAIPPPGPVCQEGEYCGCWHMPPESPNWLEATCPAGQQCTAERTCEGVTPPPPTDPCKGVICEAGYHCALGVCVKDPVTPPPGGGCVLAGEPTQGASVPNTMGAAVNEAMHRLRPDCDIGGTCLLGSMDQQTWQAQVEAELRKAGVCAGQHGPGTDEIAVSLRVDQPWQGFHIFTGNDGTGPPPPGSVRRTVRWSPQAYTGAWMPPEGGPVQPPGYDYGCPEPRPDRVWTAETLPPGWGQDQIGQPRWKLGSGSHLAWIDTTATTIRNEPYCASIGMSPDANGVPRAGCPMRPEGNPDRVACERYVAEGDWIVVASPGATCEQNPSNSAQFRRTSSGGTCRLCNPAKTVCTDEY